LPSWNLVQIILRTLRMLKWCVVCSSVTFCSCSLISCTAVTGVCGLVVQHAHLIVTIQAEFIIWCFVENHSSCSFSYLKCFSFLLITNTQCFFSSTPVRHSVQFIIKNFVPFS
jgi:hypothetical protein